MSIFRKFTQSFDHINKKISELPGGFDRRTPSDLKSVFNLQYNSPENIKLLEFPSINPTRLSAESQDFFLNAFLRYNASFPANQSLGSFPESFKGNSSNMSSLIEFFLRSLIMSTYTSGIELSHSDKILTKSGLSKGKHDLSIYRGSYPLLLIRPSKLIPQQTLNPLEQSFTTLIFSLYSEFHKNPIWPLYGAISDLNNWEFIRYDGNHFFRSVNLKLFIDAKAILDLSHTILSVLDS